MQKKTTYNDFTSRDDLDAHLHAHLSTDILQTEAKNTLSI